MKKKKRKAAAAATLDSDSHQHCSLSANVEKAITKNNYPQGYDKEGNFMPCCLSCGIPVRLLWKSLSYTVSLLFIPNPQNGD